MTATWRPALAVPSAEEPPRQRFPLVAGVINPPLRGLDFGNAGSVEVRLFGDDEGAFTPVAGAAGDRWTGYVVEVRAPSGGPIYGLR